MPLISLTTDFGLADPYAGIIKGVILSICPNARIVDLTHHIAPQDLEGAAYAISASAPYFPNEAIHVVVVDPGVGSGRRIIAVENERGRFLAPDNGVLTMILEQFPPDRIAVVDKPELYLHPVSRTFHGRDVFAPVAAHLANGFHLRDLGPALEVRDLVRLQTELPARVTEKGAVAGRIIAVDRFGNLISNIGAKDLAAAFGPGMPETMAIRVWLGDNCISGISRTYQSVPHGSPLALMGSSGKLEVSVNSGDAGAYFNVGRGGRILVEKA